jgi:hypothetical protein
VVGGTATSGGNIYVGLGNGGSAGGSFVMYGGSVTGGSAKNGGNIYLASGTVTLNGGTVGGEVTVGTTTYKGGKATAGHGGNIYVASGNLVIAGATVTGGNAPASDKNGGNIYLTGANSSLTMTSGAVTDGVSKRDGGNIYITGNASAAISGGSVTKGTGRRGGNIGLNGGTLHTLSQLHQGLTVLGGLDAAHAQTQHGEDMAQLGKLGAAAVVDQNNSGLIGTLHFIIPLSVCNIRSAPWPVRCRQ